MQQQQHPTIAITAPIVPLKCPGFDVLTPQEKWYAYYFARAAWEGAKICYFQRSYESPALFYIFSTIFKQEHTNGVTLRLQAAGWTELQLQQLYVYIASFFENAGNYKSFGDTKFVPEVPQELFTQFIEKSPAFQQVQQLWLEVSKYVYEHSEPYGLIDLRESAGSNSYYSCNLSKATIEAVDKLLIKNKISELNTRVYSVADKIVVLVASSERTDSIQLEPLNGVTQVTIQYGDFAPFLKSVVSNLSKALEFAANENQRNMIVDYIEHFKGGDIEKHKDSQRHWIKDTGPVIETNIGFIESYLDPVKVRAEYEGFVAVVNKEESALLNGLVDKAEEVIKYLPWPKEFEVDEYRRPDFTSLEVVAFASSGTPLGINIPNYDEIRQTEGYKNVSLGNAYGKPKKEFLKFLDEEDLDLFHTYFSESMFLVVALHELIGHGAGKLFIEGADGQLNYKDVINPLTGDKVTTHYGANEQWHGKFGQYSSAYEECKADATALYLSTYDDVVALLLPNYTQEQRNKIVIGGWLFVVYRCLIGLEFYNPELKKWGQAHVVGRFVILQQLLNKDADIMKFHFSEVDGKPYVTAKFDHSKIHTVGKAAISDLILHLQVYKSIGAGQEGAAYFQQLAAVNDKFMEIRKIVLMHKVPRRMELQPDLTIVDGQVVLKQHPESFEGVIQSHLEHHQENLEEVKNLFLSVQQQFKN